MARACNQNILRVLRLSRDMMRLADRGDEVRSDTGCGVLYGTLRDTAYKMRHMAEQEVEAHKHAGIWDATRDPREHLRPRSSDQRGAAIRQRRGPTQERS